MQAIAELRRQLEVDERREDGAADAQTAGDHVEEDGTIVGHLIAGQQVDADQRDPQRQPAENVEHDHREDEVSGALVPLRKHLVLALAGAAALRAVAAGQRVDERHGEQHLHQCGQDKGEDDGEPDVALAGRSVPHQVAVVDVAVRHGEGRGVVEDRAHGKDAHQPGEAADEAGAHRVLVAQVRQVRLQYAEVRVDNEHQEEERTSETVNGPLCKQQLAHQLTKGPRGGPEGDQKDRNCDDVDLEYNEKAGYPVER